MIKSYPLYLGADRKIENETYFGQKVYGYFWKESKENLRVFRKIFWRNKGLEFWLLSILGSVYSDSKNFQGGELLLSYR